MKKMGDLMKDLGFNPEGSDSVKEAFIKNLIKAAYGVDVVTPTEKRIIKENPQRIVEFPQKQMAFDFDGGDQDFPARVDKKSV